MVIHGLCVICNTALIGINKIDWPHFVCKQDAIGLRGRFYVARRPRSYISFQGLEIKYVSVYKTFILSKEQYKTLEGFIILRYTYS